MLTKRFAAALLILLVPAAAQAQEAVVTSPAPIFLLPDGARTPLRTAAVNTRLSVLEERQDGWLKVEFRDPQYGPRTGYVEARFVRIHRPELEPMDLSIREELPARTPGAPIDRAASSQPEPVVVAGPRLARGWIDVNFGFALAAEERYGSVFERQMFGELARFTVDYRSPHGAEFDFGGGVMLAPAFGLGISFAGTAHHDTASLGIRIPHPFIANVYATDTARTDEKLMRSEGSVNIQAMFVGHLSPRTTARFYGGPSFFRVRQEAVSNVMFDQAFLVFLPVNHVDITRYETDVVPFDEASGWGVHLGADVSLFFSRIAGIGAFAKFSRGTVSFFDPFAEQRGELKTGGFQTGGGLRLRF